jgi:phospholipid/cholesterol/gamma-HCH transport system substrate-binding protein
MSRTRWWRRHDETPVSELGRGSTVRFAIVFLIIIAIGIYFGFTKHIPFKHGFRLKAQFATAVNIHSKSPVRIAGVDVGKVASIKREGNTGLVTMEIENKGLPIHTDATVKIRPRIFLEGNWFVELQPGSPSARTVSSGFTIPITNTSDPVQLDQVLDALNTDTRANLQQFLIGYGEGLTKEPNAKENAEQLPEVRNVTGAQAINKTYHYAPEALRGGTIINQAITGTEPHDFSKLIAGIGKVTTALNVHEQQLGELIGNFNTFFEAFANQNQSLSRLVAELPANLKGITHGLRQLGASFGPTKAFATDILPGVKLTPATVQAQIPWIEQVTASLGPQELGGVAKGLEAATPALAKLSAEQVPLYKSTEEFNKCLTKVIYPTGNTVVQDGNATSNVENYKEFWYGLVGLSGIGQNFDGNGAFAQFLVGNSGQTLVSKPTSIAGRGAGSGSGEKLLTRSPLTPLGTRPAFPATEPAYQPLQPCYKQAPAEVNNPALANGPADGS